MIGSVILKNISKTYTVQNKTVQALKNVNLTLEPNAFHVLVGRSGSGKTTLLRLLGHMEEPSEGTLQFPKTNPRIGIVFQEPRLLPWLSVYENCCFWKHGNGGNIKKVDYYLESFGLQDFRHAMPHQLSGGMAQRVALIRALSYEPDILLMDEPFGALDYFTRLQLQEELLTLFSKERHTVLFITHDVSEALRLGSVILTLKEGELTNIIPQPEPYPRMPLQDRTSLEKEILSYL